MNEEQLKAFIAGFYGITDEECETRLMKVGEGQFEIECPELRAVLDISPPVGGVQFATSVPFGSTENIQYALMRKRSLTVTRLDCVLHIDLNKRTD